MNSYRFDDLSIGMSEQFKRQITEEMENRFRELTGDVNPLHYDDSFARERQFPAHVTFGMLTASLYSTLAGVYLPGEYCLIHSIDRLSFKKPVFAGDELTVIGTIHSLEPGLRLAEIDAKVENGKKTLVSVARIRVLVLQ